MTLKTWIILGIIEQIVVFTYIMPASGYWFSFFGLTAVWTLITSSFDTEKENSGEEMIEDEGKK